MTESLVKGWHRLSPPPAPQGHSIFTLLLLSLQEKVKVQGAKKCHYKWKFLMIGQNICPISPPTFFPSNSLFPILVFPRIAESQPTVWMLENGLGLGCWKTSHEQPLMSMYEPWKMSLYRLFTLLWTRQMTAFHVRGEERPWLLKAINGLLFFSCLARVRFPHPALFHDVVLWKLLSSGFLGRVKTKESQWQQPRSFKAPM